MKRKMSLKIAAAWIALGLITFIHISKHNAQLQRGENQHLHFGNVKGFINHTLNTSQVLAFADVKDYIGCAFQCLVNVACLSFNFAILPNDSSGLHSCQLLKTDKYNHSSGFQKSELFHHYAIVSPCESFPCKDDKICRPLYDENDYECNCPDGRNGTHCEKGWFKLNTEAAVCFGATNESYGIFNIQKAGNIFAFKLAHQSGSVACARSGDESNGTKWGCLSYLGTHITNASNERLFPVNDSLSWVPGASLFYTLPGFNYTSNEIEFRFFDSPLLVRVDQEFRVWYGEDLANHTDEKNPPGKSCIDVYGFY